MTENRVSNKELTKSDLKRRITPQKWESFLRCLTNGQTIGSSLAAAVIPRDAYQVLMFTDDEKREQRDHARGEYRRMIWTDDIMEAIFLEISQGELAGKSIQKWCPIQLDPTKATSHFYSMISQDPLLKEQYDHAREVQMWGMADALLEISDNAANDLIPGAKEDKAGNPVMVSNPSAVRRAEVEIRTRQWMMEKLFSKQFGTKIQNDHKVEVVNHADQLDAARRRKAIQATKHTEKLVKGQVVEKSSE